MSELAYNLVDCLGLDLFEEKGDLKGSAEYSVADSPIKFKMEVLFGKERAKEVFVMMKVKGKLYMFASSYLVKDKPVLHTMLINADALGHIPNSASFSNIVLDTTAILNKVRKGSVGEFAYNKLTKEWVKLC